MMKGSDDHKGEIPETGADMPQGAERSSIRLLFRRGVAGLIRGYQRFISPALPSSCRFTPTCSEYTRQAIIKHGVLKGSWLGTKRILKCHPFHPGGEDPVP